MRRALLSLISVASCFAFQSPLVRGGGLALRGRNFSLQRLIASKAPRDEIKQLLLARPSRVPMSSAAAMPAAQDEQLGLLAPLEIATPLEFESMQFPREEEAPNFLVVPDQALVETFVEMSPVAMQTTALHPRTPTRVLGILAALFGLISLASSIPQSSVVFAHFAGGALGGIAALAVSRPTDAMVTGRKRTKYAVHGMVKGISAGCYTTLTMCLGAASVAGFAGVAVASLGTGIIIGLICMAVERANALGDEMPLLERLQAKADNGLFTPDGLFGMRSYAMARDLATCVVQYEAFYLAWVGLCIANPWMGLTFEGSAVSGALSGLCSLVAGCSFQSLMNFSEFSAKVKEFWSGPVRKRDSSLRAADEATRTAVRSAALFVAYKAGYDALMLGLVRGAMRA